MTDLPTPLCTVCETNPMHGARATFTVCQPCVDWIDDHLDQVARLWPELPDHLERGRGHSGPRVSGNTQTAGSLPAAEAVLALIGPGGVHDRLSVHAVAIRQARGLIAAPATGSADHRLTTTLHHLRAHLGYATAHLDLHGFARELEKVVREMRAACGDRDEPAATELGMPCPRHVGDTLCGGPLYFDKATRRASCGSCGHEVNPDWYARLTAA